MQFWGSSRDLLFYIIVASSILPACQASDSARPVPRGNQCFILALDANCAHMLEDPLDGRIGVIDHAKFFQMWIVHDGFAINFDFLLELTGHSTATSGAWGAF